LFFLSSKYEVGSKTIYRIMIPRISFFGPNRKILVIVINTAIKDPCQALNFFIWDSTSSNIK